MQVDNECFALSLKGEWVEEKSSDSEQYLFHCEPIKAHLTISCTEIEFRTTDVEKIADRVLESRYRAETEIASDRDVYLGKPWASLLSENVMQVNYVGYDNFDRYFFYSGFVESCRLINITGELVPGDPVALEKFLKEVLSNFRFKECRKTS